MARVIAVSFVVVSVVVSVLLLAAVSCFGAVAAGSEAQYSVAGADENQSSPYTRIRVVAGDTEEVNGEVYQWWELVMEKRHGGLLGVKALTQRVPLTSYEGCGEFARYIYCPTPGEVIEYVDAQTGSALLPDTSFFRKYYVPQSYEEARFTDGFANTGSIIGHVLVRTSIRRDFPTVDFSGPTALELRGDLRIGFHTDNTDDREPMTRDDYMETIEAGANFFHPSREATEWIKNLPVFYTTLGVHPDDFYRSNFVPGKSYLDEPGIRFGWSQGVPDHIISPDVLANALTMRLRTYENPRERPFSTNGYWEIGEMDGAFDPVQSWETNIWTAQAQMAGGCPGLTYEGRYRRRGYGWSPESMLGEGLEVLTDKQQYDYFNGLLRGAARRYKGIWGISVYPEGDKTKMIPAMVRAYQQGARNFWFWNHYNLPYNWRLEVLRGLRDYINEHPRGSIEEMRDSAIAAVVLPKGYMLAPYGIAWMQREAANTFGVTYGEIGSAALFAGIMLSRANIEYDYTNDFPGLEDLGYKQLIYIRENGKIEFVPECRYVPEPKNLKLTLEPKPGPGVAGRECDLETSGTIARVENIKIDADLGDWQNVEWQTMEGQPQLFADNIELECTLKVPETVQPDSDHSYIGFTFEQINQELREKYWLEGYTTEETVLTSVTPGSPADLAGLREGDIILFANNQHMKWSFRLWGLVADHKKKPGADIHFKVKRTGIERVSGPEDLSARVAFAIDDEKFYFAACVRDNLHTQMMAPWYFWQNDSVQIGFDPTLQRSHGYGEQGHEIGFALSDGEAIAHRWSGRRGQHLGVMDNVDIAIVRGGGETVYEAAIPLTELEPMAPDMWDRIGLCVTVNDSDDGLKRKARIELAPTAMTAGKQLGKFPVFEAAPSPDKRKLSAGLIWDRRCLSAGGRAELTVAVSSPETRKAKIRTTLESVDYPNTEPARSEMEIPVTAQPEEFTLSAATDSLPGRYYLTVQVVAPDGTAAAADTQPIYVYR